MHAYNFVVSGPKFTNFLVKSLREISMPVSQHVMWKRFVRLLPWPQSYYS